MLPFRGGINESSEFKNSTQSLSPFLALNMQLLRSCLFCSAVDLALFSALEVEYTAIPPKIPDNVIIMADTTKDIFDNLIVTLLNFIS